MTLFGQRAKIRIRKDGASDLPWMMREHKGVLPRLSEDSISVARPQSGPSWELSATIAWRVEEARLWLGFQM
jgi:hypothetical protein